MEYSGKDFSHFLNRNIQIGWIPNDKAWFRGIFEERDYSNGANIYTAPNGSYRIGKRYVIHGSIRFLKDRATSESGLGIVKSGWSKVSFEINVPLMIDKTNVVVGFGDRRDEEKRIEKLKNIDFLTDEQKVRLLESLIFKGMALSLFKIAIPASKQKKYQPLMKRIIQIYQYKNVRFVFENSFLVS